MICNAKVVAGTVPVDDATGLHVIPGVKEIMKASWPAFIGARALLLYSAR